MKLFDFQESFIGDIGSSFRRNKRVIGQLATGGGKTVCMAEIARRSIAKGNVVCIAVHRIEIFEQTYRTLQRFGIHATIIAPGTNPMPGGSCYLAMIETLCRRAESKGLLEKINIDFFILDEVHDGSYFKLVDRVGSKILGFTATPKTTGKPQLNEYFDDIVCGPPIKELIRIGRLVNGVTHSVNHDFSKVAADSRDYKQADLMREFKKPKLWEGAANNYMLHANGLQAICYSVSVEQSIAVTNQLRDRGVRAAHIDAKLPEEDRKAIFKMYEERDIQVLCNVGIAVAGYDNPGTECIIQNFATTSIVKHWQSLGRGARAFEGKKKFVIIDMGRNWIRHGKFGSEEADWKKIFETPSLGSNKKEKNKLAHRECDNCGAVIKFKFLICPYCDHEIGVKELEKKMIESATTEEIKALKASTIPIHLRKQTRDMSFSELKEYANHMGYNPKWVFKQMSFRKK